jgi:DNA-binding transcriptional ArsR family regulator
MSPHETAGDELVPCKRKNLPNRVLRALDNAMHLHGLARGVRHTLAEVCRFVSQDRPFETVFAHKATIADRTGASERTVYRHLAILQQKELIEVLEQDRKARNGRFTVARIRLTRKAAALLAFIDAPEEIRIEAVDCAPGPVKTPPPEPSSQETDQAAGIDGLQSSLVTPDSPGVATAKAENGIIHSQPHAKMAGRHTLSEPTISKSQPLQRTENGLPLDLTWLTGNGLSRAGIFKLMSKAKSKRKRLSDIVTVARPYLHDLKGGKLYAYLARLTDGPTDFSVAAARERLRQHAEQQAKSIARKADNFRQRFRNTCLTNHDRTRLYVIDEHARFAQIYGNKLRSTVPLHDLGPWIERIETGRLVLATLATERRLMP